MSFFTLPACFLGGAVWFGIVRGKNERALKEKYQFIYQRAVNAAEARENEKDWIKCTPGTKFTAFLYIQGVESKKGCACSVLKDDILATIRYLEKTQSGDLEEAKRPLHQDSLFVAVPKKS